MNAESAGNGAHLHPALGMYLLGGVHGEDRAAIEDHLARCAGCLREADVLGSAVEALAALDAEDAAEFLAGREVVPEAPPRAGSPIRPPPARAVGHPVPEPDAAGDRRSRRRRRAHHRHDVGFALGRGRDAGDTGHTAAAAAVATADHTTGATLSVILASTQARTATVHATVTGLHDGERYQLIVVTVDGRHEAGDRQDRAARLLPVMIAKLTDDAAPEPHQGLSPVAPDSWALGGLQATLEHHSHQPEPPDAAASGPEVSGPFDDHPPTGPVYATSLLRYLARSAPDIQSPVGADYCLLRAMVDGAVNPDRAARLALGAARTPVDMARTTLFLTFAATVEHTRQETRSWPGASGRPRGGALFQRLPASCGSASASAMPRTAWSGSCCGRRLRDWLSHRPDPAHADDVELTAVADQLTSC